MLDYSASNYAVQCNTKQFKQIYLHWYNRMSMNIIVYKRLCVQFPFQEKSKSKNNVYDVFCVQVENLERQRWNYLWDLLSGRVWSGPPTATDVVTTTNTIFAG